ncbi:MAG: divergent polysaccharide deacetylase family protein [Alicyclobacillus sp.]|nr:divergent polysaccharide deacetylase family protein [Alicyclobacillus sp.]
MGKATGWRRTAVALMSLGTSVVSSWAGPVHDRDLRLTLAQTKPMLLANAAHAISKPASDETASDDARTVDKRAKLRPDRIAIIIDDLGNSMKGSKELFTLKEPMTVAIMPFLPSSRTDAIQAHKAGFEVLLHIPMEPIRGRRSWLGPGAITTSMSDAEILAKVRQEIESIPFVAGVNNHMGSKATADARVVRDVVEVVKQKHLFIVDSATSQRSKMLTIARQMGVPCIRRDVFLDDENRIDYVMRKVRELVQDAHRSGRAVGIGHVGRQGLTTYRAIRGMLHYIHRDGVQIVPVSALVKPG